jgi:hypothetical protein
MRVTERAIDATGQARRLPEVGIAGGWTSLELPDAHIIGRDEEPATREQFHAECKTDLDIERLPSGQFATHDRVLAMVALIYNILRDIGRARPHRPARRR